MATKRPQKVTLFVEGTSDDTNGDLRQGFASLLERELIGKMPSIKLGDGIHQTIAKFTKAEGVKFLLIDLDNASETKKERLKELKLPESQTFFMVQAMEAWFLSQPDMLNEFYKKDLKIASRPAQDISKPDKELKRLTRNTDKKEYHKVRHAVELLGKLDANKLQEDFSDVKNLLDILKKA
jgi:Domain of unknown function (DUF4276)